MRKRIILVPTCHMMNDGECSANIDLVIYHLSSAQLIRKLREKENVKYIALLKVIPYQTEIALCKIKNKNFCIFT